jgi:transmembrane sensor
MDGWLVTVGELDITAEMALAEAAAWLTELQDKGRTAASEAAFREWLEADPAHARAFARVTDVWDVLPGAVAFEDQTEYAPPRRRSWAYAMAASVALMLGIGGYAAFDRNPVYETPRGQQRALALTDGSHIALNTDSMVEVDYSADERRVRLDRGEVLFNVAKNAKRPFIVEAGDEEIRAVGTSFVVRRDAGGKVSVTLLQGVVKVTRRAQATAAVQPPAVLQPGERLTMNATQIALDRPRLEAITAWRAGNVMFDDQPLSDAVVEFNRYGTTQIVLQDPRLGSLRISGIFDANAPQQFAELAASIHGLRVSHEGDRLELRRP